MTPHRAFTVDESSQVGEVRRAAVALASELGFSEVVAGRAALVVTELGTNLVKHAPGGRLLLGVADAGTAHVAMEVLSLDHGRGMADVGLCLADGYSTAGTPGTGLGAVRRLADAFDAFSAPGHGTVIVTRLGRDRAGTRPDSAFRVAGLCTAAPGEFVSGDAWGVSEADGTARVVMADGLGHGPLAAEASDLAVSLFLESPDGAPSSWVKDAHTPMRSTRGAAVAALRLDARAGTVTICGAGNISARIVSGVVDRTLLSQHGTLGVQIGRPQDAVYPWPDHAFVILHSDGIVTRWDLSSLPGLLQCSPSVIAAWLLNDHLRGKDDATVVVIQRH